MNRGMVERWRAERGRREGGERVERGQKGKRSVVERKGKRRRREGRDAL